MVFCNGGSWEVETNRLSKEYGEKATSTFSALACFLERVCLCIEHMKKWNEKGNLIFGDAMREIMPSSSSPATMAALLQRTKRPQHQQDDDGADPMNLRSLFRAADACLFSSTGGSSSVRHEFPSIEWASDDEVEGEEDTKTSESSNDDKEPTLPSGMLPTPRSKRRMATELQQICPWPSASTDNALVMEPPAKKAFLGIQRVKPHRCLQTLFSSQDNASSIDLKELSNNEFEGHLSLVSTMRTSSSPGWLETPQGPGQS
mmetsp:Transcript_12379/g.34320  ORF Transcript_12379/g.34320 Transcript_12379/m.34320 type:complete len:260 (-) Transcript_12379:142-921(-)